jgi:hypothetical protein
MHTRRVTNHPLVPWAILVAAGMHLGCNSEIPTGNPLPCNQVMNVRCGNTCSSDAECGTGLYCDSAGSKMCTANCTAGGMGCGSGQICDSRGRCASSSSDASVPNNVPCPAGLMCDVSCTNGTTTVSGKVYDPAIKNGLYNIAVYVPATPLAPLPKGVPTGAAACSCAALYEGGAVVSTSTAEDGTFTLKNAPVGTSVPLVIQVGKWRRLYKIPVTACKDNPQADKSLSLPSSVPNGDTDDNMPDIAVSTGSADTLECLMHRIGLPKSEYVAGAGGNGHVHIFSGGETGQNVPMSVGKTERPPMMGAPVSSTGLWASQDQLMTYDIVLLSCEGGETYQANPPALEAYVNAGGRVFGSHFHYAWFAGPLLSKQGYNAPTDWGGNLATWTGGGGMDNNAIGGVIETTLNGSMTPFPRGVSMQKWLTNVNALGKNGVPNGDLSIYQPRYNAVVQPSNKPSQPWITSATGMQGQTMYFSFDTPINAPVNDAGVPEYCGRAVFSDLHVAGDPTTNDNPPPPDGCNSNDLSPQEKALEFMLFDLSSCVNGDNVPPPGQPIG